MSVPSASESYSPIRTVTILDVHGTWNDVKRMGTILFAELMSMDIVSESTQLPGSLKDFLSTGSLGSEMQTSLTI